MRDGRLEFFLCGINAKEFNESCDAGSWVFRQLCKVNSKDWNLWMGLDESLPVFEQRSLQSLASRIVGGEPLATMFVASILKRTDRGFDRAINCDDSKRVSQTCIQVLCESAQMWLLGTGNRLVTIGFRLTTNDPAFELLCKLPIADLRIDRWESHDTLTEFG